MKKTITAVNFGNVVNVYVGGKLHRKSCATPELADEFFRICNDAKANPSDENVLNVLGFLNETTRMAMACGMETNIETGDVFLAGFNTPVPQDIVELVQLYNEKNYNVDSIINFWKLLMANPDVRVREDLFDFIRQHDFALTDNGYMVVYKAVAYKAQDKNDLSEFVTNQYLFVRKHWDTSVKKYVVYRKEDGTLHITKKSTFKNWDVDEKGVELCGNLHDLFKNIDALIEDCDTVYTDKHSHTMEIKLGQVVSMPRSECDADPYQSCSYGLHVGATSYVNMFASSGNAVLVCYVNPMHVVAVPDSDNSKMRVTEYFPFAMATYNDGEIDVIEEAYFESDYTAYEKSELEAMVQTIQDDERPLETAMCALEDERDLDELQKIIEARMIDLQ